MKATQKPSTEVRVTPADILRFAALYIERHGWNQGTYYTNTTGQAFPPACATGAIGMAVTGHQVIHALDLDTDSRADYLAAFNALVDHLDDINIGWDDPEPDERISPYSWNDDPDRTATDVIATLRAAADTCDDNIGGAW